MRSSRLQRIVLVALSAVALAGSAGAASLTLERPGLGYAVTGLFWNSEESLDPAAISGNASQAIAAGGNAAASQYMFSDSGLSITFDHRRAGDPDASPYEDQAYSYGVVFFSVDTDAEYLVDGRYTAVDPEGRLVLLRISLVDETLRPDPAHPLAGAFPFQSYQESRSTPNESFRAGLLEGDYGNGPVGGDPISPTGTLVAGHVYGFYWEAAIGANVPATLPASATGHANLLFVPEPGTGVLLAAGLTLLTMRRRRRHRRRFGLGPLHDSAVVSKKLRQLGID